MQYIIEIELVVIPFDTLVDDVIVPAFEQWDVLQLGAIPRCGILGQTFQHQERAYEGRAERDSVVPQALPVVRACRPRYGHLVWTYRPGMCSEASIPVTVNAVRAQWRQRRGTWCVPLYISQFGRRNSYRCLGFRHGVGNGVCLVGDNDGSLCARRSCDNGEDEKKNDA